MCGLNKKWVSKEFRCYFDVQRRWQHKLITGEEINGTYAVDVIAQPKYGIIIEAQVCGVILRGKELNSIQHSGSYDQNVIFFVYFFLNRFF